MIKPRTYNIKRPPIQFIVLADLLAALIAVVLVYWLWPQWLVSLLTGICIFLIPNGFFIWYAFRYMGAKWAKQVAISLFAGEVVKFVLTLSLFAYSFIVLSLDNYMVMFSAYIGLWLVHQLTAFVVIGSSTKNLNLKIR